MNYPDICQRSLVSTYLITPVILVMRKKTRICLQDILIHAGEVTLNYFCPLLKRCLLPLRANSFLFEKTFQKGFNMWSKQEVPKVGCFPCENCQTQQRISSPYKICLGRPRWLSLMYIRLVIRRLRVRLPPGWQQFLEIDHEIFSMVTLSFPLIQEGHLSVSGERMCTVLANSLED